MSESALPRTAPADAIGVAALQPLAPRSSSQRPVFWLVALLSVAIFINYVDRGNLATAAPLIKDELKLSNTQIGILLSAFFWTYAPVQILVGWLTERISAHYLFALGLAVWAIATTLTGFASGFLMLLMLRILLGVGESFAYPCSSKLLAENLPPENLGAANGILQSGIGLGPAFGTLAGGLVMVHFGWRAVFLLFGLVPLMWLWPWFALIRRGGSHAVRTSIDGTPRYRDIVRKRAAWGTAVAHFANAYPWYFVLSWLPLYLIKDRGFSVVEMARLGALVYLVNAVGSALSGWLSDRWILRGTPVNLVRKSVSVAGSIGVAICMLASATGVTALAVAGFLMAAWFMGMNNFNNFAIAQTIAGPRATGKWVALQNSFANLSGIVGPIITGFIIDRTGTFTAAFVLTSAIALAGALCWGLIVPRVAPIDWSQTGDGGIRSALTYNK